MGNKAYLRKYRYTAKRSIDKAIGKRAVYLWQQGHGLRYLASDDKVQFLVKVDREMRRVYVGDGLYLFPAQFIPGKSKFEDTVVFIPYKLTPI